MGRAYARIRTLLSPSSPSFHHRSRRLTRRLFSAPVSRRVAPRRAEAVAVTFNSRARRRPICVVRTPITPDKTGGNLFTEHEGCHHATPSYVLPPSCLHPSPVLLSRSAKRRREEERSVKRKRVYTFAVPSLMDVAPIYLASLSVSARGPP